MTAIFKLLLVLVFFSVGSAYAQTTTSAANFGPNQLFAPVTLTGGRSSTAAVTDKQVVRSREVAINMDLLTRLVAVAPGIKAPKPSLTFELFDGQVLTAVPVEVKNTKRGVSWIGTIEGTEHGQVVIAISDGVVSANITLPTGRFHIRFLQSGVYQVQQIDTTLFPPDHPPADLAPAISRPTEPEKSSIAGPFDDGSIIDVMVVYTAAARAAAGGTAAIVSLIDTAMAETNASYLTSGIVQRVRLVHAEEVSYVETSSTSSAAFNAALTCIQSTSDGCLDAVHTVRNTYGADVVSLWIENSGSCGLGYVDSSATSAFSVVARTCATGYYSFGHEMGHNMGARHDPYVDTSTTPRTYQHGTTNAAAASPWRTVMAYNDACIAAGVSCTRIPYWSNPNVTYSGAAMGDVTVRDNHRVLNETAYTVANFRSSIQSTLPAAPTIGTAVAGNATISVAFTPGAIGSGTLVSYWAYCTPDGGVTVVYGTGASSPINVAPVVNGSAYVCYALTRSTVGDSPWSAASNVVTPIATPLPDLIVSALTAPTTGTIGSQIAMTSSVTNQGSASAAAYRLGFYFSTDSTITTGDVFSTTVCNMSALAPSGTFSCSGQVSVPASLSPGTYYFGAIADDLGAISETSEANNTRSTLITLSAPADTTPPTIPTSVTATTASSSQINLSWGASTDSGGSNLAGYSIERCAGVGCSSFSLLTTTTSTVYSNTGLSASTPYSYRIRAYDNASNYSGYSGTATATTSSAADTTPPTIPSSFTATTASSSQINLSWGASTDSGGSGLAGYAIERCTGVGCSGFALLTTTTSTSYSNTGLSASTSYSYRVRAYDNAANYSGYSGVASAMTTANAADTFPLNCQMPSGWTVPGTAQSGWSVVANEASEGSCSLKSNTIADSQTAQIQFAGTFTAGNISFSRKVSSEGGWDCLRFYVDGVPQSIGGTCNWGGVGASGEILWSSVTVPISAGSHTLVWSYEKDGSYFAGQDTAWIDAVVLPPGTGGSHDITPILFLLLFD